MLILIQWILGDLYRLNSQAERQQGMLIERLEIQGQMSKPLAFTCQVDATLFPQENKVTFGAAMLSQDAFAILCPSASSSRILTHTSSLYSSVKSPSSLHSPVLTASIWNANGLYGVGLIMVCEKNFMQEDDVLLETTRAKFSNVLKRHGELAERLSRDSDKTIFERLHREFEAARASQAQEISLEGEQWNDGLLATIRERVHIEADIKAMQMPGDTAQSPIPCQEKVTYKIGNKDYHNELACHVQGVICCLEGARIGIQYETSFAGETCELYHCVLESKSFLEKMTVIEHTVPFFLPIREAENEFLSSNAMKFIDHVGDLLQAYVDRREQVRLIKELYGNQLGQLYHSLPYHMIEFVLDDFDCRITVCLRYADLVSTLPTGVSVVAWPAQHSKKSSNFIASTRKGNYPVPERLTYAEEALRTMSLPEAYAEIVLNLQQALGDVFVPEGPA
nr:centromere protein O [Ipomoea batatas]